MNSPDRSGDGAVDLEAVRQLLQTLEADLAQVQSGAKPLAVLRDEVAALRAVVHGSAPGGDVVERLLTVQNSLGDAVEQLEAAALTPVDYLARIGRLLGM